MTEPVSYTFRDFARDLAEHLKVDRIWLIVSAANPADLALHSWRAVDPSTVFRLSESAVAGTPDSVPATAELIRQTLTPHRHPQ